MDHIQPVVSMKQLLDVVPECRALLSISLILHLGAPRIDVTSHGVIIIVDGGSSVNFMNAYTMQRLVPLTNP